MRFIEAGQLVAKEPRPGWLGRFFHSERMTFAYYEIQPGAGVHLHHHPNEEVWHVIDGEVEMVVGDDRRVVHATVSRHRGARPDTREAGLPIPAR